MGSPATDCGPQRLGLAHHVVLDDRVRCIEDRLRRAVVLLERDDLRVRPVAFEVEQVLDRGSPERVDALVHVADDEDVAPLPGEQGRPPRLRVVRVLELVDQHVREALLVVLRERPGIDRRPRRMRMMRSSKSNAEASVQPVLVLGVDLGDRSLPRIRRRSWRTGPASISLFFASEIACSDRPRRHPLGVDVELLHAQLDQPLACPPSRRSRTTTRMPSLGASRRRIRTQAEWKVETHMLSGDGPDELGDPALHLAGGLVGEGDGEDRVGRHARAR